MTIDASLICLCFHFTLGFVACLLEGKMKRNDEERQKVLIEEFITTTLPAFLDMMQKVLEENGGNYLVGSDVSLGAMLLTFIQ